MARIKWKDLEVEADTPADVVILLDKLITYQKIREVNTDALAYCPVCLSFDLSMISPSEVECNVCGTVMDAFGEEVEIEVELDDGNFTQLEIEGEIEGTDEEK